MYPDLGVCLHQFTAHSFLCEFLTRKLMEIEKYYRFKLLLLAGVYCFEVPSGLIFALG